MSDTIMLLPSPSPLARPYNVKPHLRFEAESFAIIDGHRQLGAFRFRQQQTQNGAN